MEELAQPLLDEIVDPSEKPYNPAEWLSEQCDKRGINKSEAVTTTYARKKKFNQICEIVEKELKDTIENQDDNEWLNRQHEAIIGKQEAVNYFLAAIENVLREKNITSNDYPKYFDSLAHAVFHEVWGVGILAKWEAYPESEACVIHGTELWLDINGQFVKQEEEFESLGRVERIKRAFLIRTPENVLNRENPEVELEREDGSRITMIAPPRSRHNYVMLRRFVVSNFTLQHQANLGTIPERDIPIYRALARTMPNTVFAGRVRSAKSTFMKTMIGERNPEYVIGCLEKHFELALKKHFPERLVFEVQAKEGDLHTAVPRLLRMEHDYIVVGEIRSLEIEAFMQSTERGERGAMTTYHLTDVDNVVPQLARHLLDEYPNRIPAMEEERVAKNVDIVISLASDRDRRRKRVIGVTEVVWDYETRTYSAIDLIRYSPLTDKYYYNASISNRLLRLMAEEDLEQAQRLIQILKEREKESPMKEYAGNFEIGNVAVEVEGEQ